LFFEKKPHPKLKEDIVFEFKEGKENYWERREIGDW
jgi:hypothetical protein